MNVAKRRYGSRREELIAAVAKVGVPEAVRRIKSVAHETDSQADKLEAMSWREADWFEDACALVRRLVPPAEPYEVQHAAERIVAQLQQVWMHHGRRPAVEEAAKLASQQLGTLKAVAAKKAKQANLSNTPKD